MKIKEILLLPLKYCLYHGDQESEPLQAAPDHGHGVCVGHCVRRG